MQIHPLTINHTWIFWLSNRYNQFSGHAVLSNMLVIMHHIITPTYPFLLLWHLDCLLKSWCVSWWLLLLWIKADICAHADHLFCVIIVGVPLLSYFHYDRRYQKIKGKHRNTCGCARCLPMRGKTGIKMMKKPTSRNNSARTESDRTQ